MYKLKLSSTESDRSQELSFEDEEIVIGFRKGNHLCLDTFSPDHGELLVRSNASTTSAHPAFMLGFYDLNGEPINGSTTIKSGDVISCGPHSIEWLELPSDLPDEEEDQATTEDSGAAATSDSDYLILFFEPIKAYLEDPEVSEVMINGPDQIFVEKKGSMDLVPEKFATESALQAACKNVARSVGRIFDEDNPRLDARLPDGSRVHAVLPPMAACGTTIAIRKFSKDKLTLDQLVEFGSITPDLKTFIQTIVAGHKNIIVSGATSSGKTSVLNVLSGCIPEHERILVLEDARELQLQQPHTVYFETRKPDQYGKGEVSIRDLLHSTLRLRPDRLVVGEIRGGEALDLLQALNTGHAGSMSTIHANTPFDTLFRLETCAMLSGLEMPLSALRAQVASAVNVIIQTARLTDGSRKITHISEVLGLENGEYKVQDLVTFKQESIDSDGKIVGKHSGCGNLPTFLDEFKAAKLEIDEGWFKAP